MILELFSSVLIPLYSEWLCMDDLAHLDVAVCNTTLRDSFVGQLTKCSLLPVKSSNMAGVCEKDALDWVYTRGIKLRAISISDFDKPVANKRKFSLLVNKLDWLQASNCNVLEVALSYCSLIMALHLDCIENESFIRLLPRLTDLQELKISTFGYHISHSCMDAIVECCPHLRVFEATADTAIVIRGCKELTEVQTILTSDAVEALVEANNLTNLSVLSKISGDSDDSDGDSDADHSNVENVIKVIRKTSQLLSFLCDFSINDEVLIALSEHCPFLKCLRATHTNDITDAGLRELAKCSDLSDLHISFDLVTDEGLTHLVKSCRNLTVLLTTECHRLSDTAVLNVLRYCEKLKELRLYSNKCTDVGFMRAFSMRPSLEVLHGRLLTSKSMIGNVFDVEYLKASNSRFVLRKTVRSSQVYKLEFGTLALKLTDWTAVIIQMPSLLKAHFRSLDITDKVVEALIMYCPRLTDVSVVYCPSVTANGIGMLIRSCRNLTKLTVRQDKMIAKPYDRGTNPSYTSTLTHLVLQHCADSWVLDVVAAMCPLLRSFEVSSTIVGSDDICRLILCCPQLTHMNVSHCSLVDGSVLQAICECVAGGSRQWKSVNVEGCDGITKKDAAKYAPDFKEMGMVLTL